MNTDQIKGKSKIVAGKVQEKVGKVFGSPSQQLKGKGKQIAGRLQKGAGDAEEAAHEAAEDIREDLENE